MIDKAVIIRCKKCGTGMWQGGVCDFCSGKVPPPKFTEKIFTEERLEEPDPNKKYWWKK